jgi:hypothetical protein
MNSSRNIEQRNDEQKERIERYCNSQTEPYRIASYALAGATGWSLGSGKFQAGLVFGVGSLFSYSLESSIFEKCVKEESDKKTTTHKIGKS